MSSPPRPWRARSRARGDLWRSIEVRPARGGCDKKLRDALIDFAGGSRFDNVWAADIYGRAIARGKRHPHALRILARAWVYVIWRCWQDGVPYRPGRHQALQRVTLARAA